MFDMGRFGWLKFRHFRRRNKGRIILALIFISIPGIIAFWGGKEIATIINKTREEAKVSPSSMSVEIAGAIKEGDYITAVNNIRDELNKDPNNISLKNLLSQLTDELNVDIKFHYLIGRKKYMDTRTLSQNVALTSKDPYYFTVSPSHRSYLYMFQVDSAARVTVVYPSKEYSPSENPLLPGPIRIPDGFRWFYLDETKGIETIYLIAARFENKKLEDLSRRIGTEKNPDAVALLSQELISYLKGVESITQNVHGVAVKVYQFTHG